MSVLLKNCTGRDNHFNFIRFLAAILVIFSHSYDLTLGSSVDEPIKKLLGISGGGIAVDVFFVTSGYLVTASLFRSKDIKSYFAARILRIYPALIVSVSLTIILFGLFVSSVEFQKYLFDSQTLKFFIKNITLILGVSYELPGVFVNNPYPLAVNGSLWTLPHEIRAYIFIAIIYMLLGFANFKSARNVRILFFCMSIFFISLQLIAHIFSLTMPLGKFVHLFGIFFIGAVFYLYREYIILRPVYFIAASTAIFLAGYLSKSILIILYPFLLGYIVFFLAYFYKGFLLNFNRLGDYSYGIYIYGFPVQQVIVSLFDNISVFSLTMFASVLCIALGFISWNLVEKPCLKLKKWFI